MCVIGLCRNNVLVVTCHMLLQFWHCKLHCVPLSRLSHGEMEEVLLCFFCCLKELDDSSLSTSSQVEELEER